MFIKLDGTSFAIYKINNNLILEKSIILKGIFDSYLNKISNLLGRNETTFSEQISVEESRFDTHMSYSEYIKYINEQEEKMATPLQNNITNHH